MADLIERRGLLTREIDRGESARGERWRRFDLTAALGDAGGQNCAPDARGAAGVIGGHPGGELAELLRNWRQVEGAGNRLCFEGRRLDYGADHAYDLAPGDGDFHDLPDRQRGPIVMISKARRFSGIGQGSDEIVLPGIHRHKVYLERLPT